MNTLIANRRSIRKFDPSVEIPKADLLEMLKAAQFAPSACNSQPWSYVVAETPEIVEKVAKCGQQMRMNPFLTQAKAFIIVLEEHAVLRAAVSGLLDSQYFAKGDLGATTVQICLEAEAQGLGTCIIGVYDRVKLCELLNIPQEKQFAAFIAVGYPAGDDVVRPKDRKALADIARYV